MKTAAILVGAGVSQRFGEDKIFRSLGGAPLLRWTMEPFLLSKSISTIILVLHADRLLLAEPFRNMPKVQAIVAGGTKRQDSVRAGLSALDDEVHVLVHDVARPCLTMDLVERLVDCLIHFPAVIPVWPVKETVKSIEGNGRVQKTLPRNNLYWAQTPQAFQRVLLEEAHKNAVGGKENALDDASLVEKLGVEVHAIPGDEANIKVTTPLDWILATKILEGKELS
ncbi:MAG: 2-C-methyl-D-erythritol 4-phosphate cytidylyltransferase [Coprothermobacterota bacterium]|nr:2-C-methyl-D-erythritol 4-phosphate cytidylyltransferase [Coprothermobacterota bacterium]